MARKSTQAAQARERARMRANRFLEREQRLLEIAERYEETQVELGGLEETLEAKIDKIREQAEAKIAEAREQASVDASGSRERAKQLQREMLGEGITRKEVGERLGIPTREVAREKKRSSSSRGIWLRSTCPWSMEQ